MGGGGTVPALHVDPVAGGLFGALNGPPSVPVTVTVTHAPVPAEGVGGKGKRAAGAKPPATDKPRVWGYQEAIDAWDLAWAEERDGTVYPWVFKGQHADGKYVKTWLAQAKIHNEGDVVPGIARLRGAFLAYFRAANAGAAFPRGDPPTTKHLTDQLAKWLQVDPSEAPRGNGTESKQGAALRALGKIDLSRFKKPKENP